MFLNNAMHLKECIERTLHLSGLYSKPRLDIHVYSDQILIKESPVLTHSPPPCVHHLCLLMPGKVDNGGGQSGFTHDLAADGAPIRIRSSAIYPQVQTFVVEPMAASPQRKR
jgi:hypothetical protein